MSLQLCFNRATNYLATLTSELSSEELLKFYALYKQATVGPCNTTKPSFYQVEAKYKWEAWKKLGETSCEAAMCQYIEELTKLDSDWEQKSPTGQGWVLVSQLKNTEEQPSDSEKTFFDWVKEGDEAKVKQSVELNHEILESVDSEGLFPIHWAADRGHVEILKVLVENGANFEVKDPGGQTALHYAASCGHFEAVRYLLSIGAKSTQDNDGLKPEDVADEVVSQLF